MAAGLYNFIIEQGATVSFRIDWKDSDNNPIDLTSYQARMHIRNQPGGNDLYATLSSSLTPCGTGLNLTPTVDGLTYPLSSGSIEVYISARSSSILNFDKAYYDLELVTIEDDCEVVTRLLQGKVKLSKEVTK